MKKDSLFAPRDVRHATAMSSAKYPATTASIRAGLTRAF
jgi:hypothetical protein